MRDITIIDKILSGIKEVWTTVTDLRLGQLFLNVLQDPALYYVEDEQLVSYLKKYYTGENNE